MQDKTLFLFLTKHVCFVAINAEHNPSLVSMQCQDKSGRNAGVTFGSGIRAEATDAASSPEVGKASPRRSIVELFPGKMDKSLQVRLFDPV